MGVCGCCQEKRANKSDEKIKSNGNNEKSNEKNELSSSEKIKTEKNKEDFETQNTPNGGNEIHKKKIENEIQENNSLIKPKNNSKINDKNNYNENIQEQPLKEKEVIGEKNNSNNNFEPNINNNLNQNIIKEDINDKNERITYPNISEVDLDIMEYNHIKEITAPKSIEVEFISKVENFMNETKIQDEFSENDKEENENKTYKELKKYEKEQLKKIFLENKDKLKNKMFDIKNININIDTSLISTIINSEKTKDVFKNIMIKKIGNIKSDENKYKIDHLTILLVGKSKSGKKSLIKYILNLKDSQTKSEKGRKKENFEAFQNPNIPYLRLVKYKGIGLGNDNDVEIITNQTINYIANQNKKRSYNDFVHCIWYCFTGTRLEKSEEEYLKRLRNSYSDVNMPIILIYLNEYNNNKITEMEQDIKKSKLDVDFINVIAKVIRKPNNQGTIDSRGKEELMNLTLDKCRTALQGDMPKIMMKNISNEILYEMKKLIEKNKTKVKDNIKEKFINEFINVLDDNKLIDYFITLLGRNLSIFYEKNISNTSLNLLINSEIIKSVETFMMKCKNMTKDLISSVIISNANDFIDKQASLEKINKENINIENKRSIKGFIKTNEIYLKKNFYYISQKYIIYYFILYFCNDYFDEFQKQFNKIIENLINQDEHSEINKFIADCFGSKLKKFGEKINVNFCVEKYENNNEDILNDAKNNLSRESLLIKIENKNDNSFDLINEEEEDIVHIESDKVENIPLPKLIKSKNGWRYLGEDLSLILLNFMNNFNLKDTSENYFNKNNFFSNSLLNSLKKYEKNDLSLYLNDNLEKFFLLIVDKFKIIKSKYELINNKKNLIKMILDKEGIEKIQLYKIEKEFEKLGKDIQYVKLDYITIIITGRTGVGKSSLINALLKEYLAEEGMKDIITTKPFKYENEKVKFLKLIDTRGIEINKEFGINKIFNEISSIINDPYELEKYKEDKEEFHSVNFINEKKKYIIMIMYNAFGIVLQKKV